MREGPPEETSEEDRRRTGPISDGQPLDSPVVVLEKTVGGQTINEIVNQ
jgi:hypothetical protein